MYEGKPKRHYVSYLLRLWETADGERHTWRASLESPGAQRRLNFVSLAELIAYLERLTKEQGESRPE